jgi:parallel beta-helix repeat protein
MKIQGNQVLLTRGLTIAGVMAGLAIGLPLVQASAIASSTTPSDQAFQVAQAGTMVLYVNSALGQDSPTSGKAEASPLKTITYALQQAQPGTIIQLASGSYTTANGEVFPLMMKPGVTLRGDEASKGQTTTIIGGGQVNTISLGRQNITIFAAQDSVIRGVNVTNPLSRGTGIWVESTNPTIANCTFANSEREGIMVTGTGNPLVEGSIFLKNAGNGISIARAATGTVRNSLFQDTGFGLAIGGTSKPRIEGNQIVSNRSGFYINEQAQPVLRGNTIRNNVETGLVVTMTAKPNLGTTADNGNNIIKTNGKLAIENVSSQQVLAIGNDLDVKSIYGDVVVTAKSIDDPVVIDPGTGGNTGSAFTDVKGHWAEGYITQLASRGVITGFPDKSFKPEAPVTRAQFATIVTKAFNPPAIRNAVVFNDVSKSFWGFDQITAASRGGFMSGYPGNIFKPEQQIPRVQALVAIANGLQFGEGNVSILTKYKDGSAIPAYATGFVASATQRRVVVNYPDLTMLNPNREATRAEVAAFVYQALVNAGKANAIPSNFIVSP